MKAILKDKCFLRTIALLLTFFILAGACYSFDFGFASVVILCLLPIVIGFSIGSLMSSRVAFVISLLLAPIIVIPIFMGVFRFVSGELIDLWFFSLYCILLVPVAFTFSAIDFLYKRYKVIGKRNCALKA